MIAYGLNDSDCRAPRFVNEWKKHSRLTLQSTSRTYLGMSSRGSPSCVAATRELLYKLLHVRAFTVSADIRACIDKATELYWLRRWFQARRVPPRSATCSPAAEPGSACRDEVTDG
jgi:hypothetical protein